MTTETERAIPEDVRAEIMRRMRHAEAEHGVRILLAVESGSRAWGFSSRNSDYDARFIYIHPREWYLAVDLEEKRDVIEYKIVDDIDLNGWDIRKALRLFAKSNHAFIEWIQSPLVYIEQGEFAARCRNLLHTYSTTRGIYHYRSMAKTNYRGYLKADLVPLKKYFYVLRPLLSVRWIETYLTAPPIEFAKLLHLIADREALCTAIDGLLQQKRRAPEMGLAPQVPAIHAYIEDELARLETLAPDEESTMTVRDELNNLFRYCLMESA